jgi:rubrerythrin
MGAPAECGEYPPMHTAHRYEGRTLSNADAVAREARRLVGFERSYRCVDCGHEHRSWSRRSSCPDCGTAYVAAVIHRAALA